MAGSGDNLSGRRVISQINVTPLVDVMLVLLIIFMVTAPMMKEGINVNLPRVNASGLALSEEPLVVTVDTNGKLFIMDAPVEFDEMRGKLKAIVLHRKDKSVLLKADEMVPYGAVAGAMGEIRKAGIAKIGMLTEPVGKKK